MRRQFLRPFILLLAALTLMAGAAVADEPTYTEGERTFYPAWQDCGGDNDTYLSETVPGLNSCGWSGLPLGEVLHAMGDPWIDVYDTETPVSFLLDANRELTGEIHVHSATGLSGAGLGDVVVEGTLSARIAGKMVTLGEFSDSGTATPLEDTISFPLSFDIDEAHHLKAVTSIQLDLIVRGVNVDSAVEAAGGLSKLVIPTLVPDAIS